MRHHPIDLRPVVLLAVAACVACSSDWSVRAYSDAGAADGTGDGVGDGDSGTDDATAAVDAASEGGGDCASLLAKAASAKGAAISCTLGQVSDCSTSTPDECGCTVFIAKVGSTAAKDYVNAVAAVESAGCTGGCVGCPAVPTRGTCIQSASGFACSPP